MLLAACFNSTAGDSRYDERCDINKDNSVSMTDVMMIAVKFNTAY
jgi:hypothetical protein